MRPVYRSVALVYETSSYEAYDWIVSHADTRLERAVNTLAWERMMREVDPQRPGERLQVAGPQEVRELVVVFNDMLDRLELERRESGQRALAAQEGERWRVAQELHDDVGQVLTGVLLRMEALARQAPADLLPNVRATQELSLIHI